MGETRTGEASGTPDRSTCIFGNAMPQGVIDSAQRAKAKFVRRFGDDSDVVYHLETKPLPVIGDRLGVRNLVIAKPEATALDLIADARSCVLPEPTSRTVEGADGAPVIVGNIRMGFGHYRIAMAMASAAHAMGYTPYWLDLCGLAGTTASKVIASQNELYSRGSRMSQNSGLFNKAVWEPLNYEGFRKIEYNASDQKVAELYAAPLRDLPRDVPFIGTHVWPSQAAVHAGLTHVVNAIPDNWPMALHLAEGSIHTVQTPGAFLGYHELRGMGKSRAMTKAFPSGLSPMPQGSLVMTGHYVDHELVENIAVDCAARRARLAADAGTAAPVRWLLTVGGAGAQQQLYASIVEHLLPYVERGEAMLLVNVGDHRDAWDTIKTAVPRAGAIAKEHFDDFEEVARFSDALRGNGEAGGIHVFCSSDIFAAVYSTNLLMRGCDMLVTKPSELSFYPVPKLMIRRVGGHERWGAIRAAEIGDGTYELETPEETFAMIDSLQREHGLIAGMCDAIEKANAIGIYDGAYRVVELAVAR